MGEDHDDAGRTHALAVAAALAVFGVSVGVNVHELMAADPATMQSDQGKIGFESIKGNSLPPQRDSLQQKFDTTQQKFAPATQQKLPSRQDKDRVMPGVKSMDPPR
jgi:hypothetical protein